VFLHFHAKFSQAKPLKGTDYRFPVQLAPVSNKMSVVVGCITVGYKQTVIEPKALPEQLIKLTPLLEGHAFVVRQ
jgi:hypothetical protein